MSWVHIDVEGLEGLPGVCKAAGEIGGYCAAEERRGAKGAWGSVLNRHGLWQSAVESLGNEVGHG